MSKPPLLWTFRRCPYAMRARMALSSSGLEVRMREILLRDKPEEFVAASPKATVPVLVAADSEVIDESLDIMLWALRRKDPEGLLSPDTGSLPDMLNLIARCEDEFKPYLDRYKYASRNGDTDPLAAREKALGFLQSLNAQLADRLCLFGRVPSLGDIAIFPFVRQFAGVDRGWFNGLDLTHLKAWLEARITSQIFTRIMSKHRPWRETGEEILMNVA